MNVMLGCMPGGHVCPHMSGLLRSLIHALLPPCLQHFGPLVTTVGCFHVPHCPIPSMNDGIVSLSVIQ